MVTVCFAKKLSSSSGISEQSISRSFIESSFFKSLLIDRLFTSAGLSHRDDARVLAALCMGNDNNPACKQTESDESLLAIVEPVILKTHTRPGKDDFDIFEAQSML